MCSMVIVSLAAHRTPLWEQAMLRRANRSAASLTSKLGCRSAGKVRFMSSSKDWPFASLDPSKRSSNNKPVLAGIVFDVDGTLCLPQNYMFKEMRDALGISKQIDILEHIEHLYSISQAEGDIARDAIREIERRAMAKQVPQPGLADLIEYLDSRGVKRSIVTRNFDEPVRHLLTKFLRPRGDQDEAVAQHLSEGLRGFHPILTRDFKPAKPAPDPLLHIAKQWRLPAEDRCSKMIMVGDSIDDVSSGVAAGATTVTLGNKDNEEIGGDWRIHNLTDLIDLLEQ